MSSREIADLTNKEHKNVIRDIDRLLEDLGQDGSSLSHELIQGVSRTIDTRGYTSEICLPKDLTLTLVAGYRADLRLRIIRRWMDLEGGVSAQPQIPQTFSEALRALADQVDGT